MFAETSPNHSRVRYIPLYKIKSVLQGVDIFLIVIVGLEKIRIKVLMTVVDFR